jgi:hypothetical protein
MMARIWLRTERFKPPPHVLDLLEQMFEVQLGEAGARSRSGCARDQA